MEAVYAALIAMASAVTVKVLDRLFARKDKTQETLAGIKAQVEKTQADVDALGEELREDQAVQCRQRILCFSDDLLHGIDHSKEYYDAVMQDINEYNLFCEGHRSFRNSVTGAAAKNIIKRYDEHMWQKDFL